MTQEQTPTLVTDDLRIKAVRDVSPPDQVRNEHPLTNAASKTVFKARHAIHNILHDRDDRLVVIVGPCSIHDPKAAIEYAQRLKAVRDTLEKDLVIVMRVYFEKPRTTVGWKGLINDPDMDNSFHINKGLRLARRLLIDMAESGMPSATEYLDLISPQYIADVVSWGAIGARTTESQVHRELASGLSCPVGFKNGTDGNMQIAIDAIGSSSRPHHFLSVTKAGNSAIFSTTGNSDCHIILRGGNGEPNYDIEHIQQAAEQLAGAGLPQHLMVDCSHANSRKQHERQMLVARDIAKQISLGETRIFGVMLESHLKEGRQSLVAGEPLVYGQSITDACLSWEDTEQLLSELAEAVRARRAVSEGFGNA
jgi:3-deoxy-7-phosphoheptulonate synthase